MICGSWVDMREGNRKKMDLNLDAEYFYKKTKSGNKTPKQQPPALV